MQCRRAPHINSPHVLWWHMRAAQGRMNEAAWKRQPCSPFCSHAAPPRPPPLSLPRLQRVAVDVEELGPREEAQQQRHPGGVHRRLDEERLGLGRAATAATAAAAAAAAAVPEGHLRSGRGEVDGIVALGRGLKCKLVADYDMGGTTGATQLSLRHHVAQHCPRLQQLAAALVACMRTAAWGQNAGSPSAGTPGMHRSRCAARPPRPPQK